MLDQEEWRQIEYLLWITQPFFKFTTALSQTKDVIFHVIFSIYNKLFDHLEVSICRLQRKKVAWKKLMLSALHAAKEKLSVYYREIDKVYGDLFAIGTILAPQNKLQFFNNKDWGPELRLYKERLSATQGSPQIPSLGVQTSKIDALFAPDFNQLVSSDEATQYLESEMAPIAPRTFWKEHEHKFLALANMVHDILLIPATGAGIERLFNSTRDQALDEEKDAQQLQDTLEPISDNEDDGLEISIDQLATQQLSKRAQGTRRMSMVSNGEQEY
ncbi:hypothetical protein TSTA_126490 [Talaromyces stipitatus ATCC 10500]|uniref:HAT C-terminal dimerisation domain-containing protein n=1 Tax=Talaromyces stipitatus (strain ATCC 10500 / CBS 375.48 / QM 6759 / NRRL 1006) TaxID=441959 RepID=B8MCN9_TALSN|nr:uncharacterized protein TSTA_126490 [Talaromyces stipitatus ATCC 10500]EED18941.1 hypothetical protein TSTA_126490 [Talaromyces stipitatus ATCC 10500]